MFRDSEERAMLREAVSGYFADRVAAAEDGWSPEGWRRLGQELGLLSAPFAEELGGAGGSFADAAIVMETLGRHRITLPYLDTVIMAGGAIAASAHPDRADWIAAIGAGDRVVAVGWMEAGARDNPMHVTLSAVPDGDGYRLDGAKIMVRAAPWASHILLSARFSGGPRDRDGIALFLVEADAPALSLRPATTIDGFACADVHLEAVCVPAQAMLIGPEAGAAALDRMMAEAAVALSAEAVGLMDGMIDQTVAYAQQRKQFGKTLASFQVLQHRMVDMRIAAEKATSLVRAAIHCVDAGQADAPLMATAALYGAGQAVGHVGREAIQIHGAIGLMEETPISRYFKRSVAIRHQQGDADHHLAVLAEHAGATLPDGTDDLMARLVDTGREDAFRAEIRAFLDAELTPELRARTAWETGAFARRDLSDAWNARLATKGWVAPAWPVEHGGPGWTPGQRQVLEAELAAVSAPRLPAMGLQMVAPVLMRFGTEEQKAHFLPRLLAGEDYWCQGYSEPGAGSDLAAVQLRADRDGEDYVLNGSKIWTTFAQFANWIFVLARTAQREKRQDGISFILVPMDSPGLTVRPLISMSGEHEVNQVFFDDVRVPVANRVGPEHEGWSVAKYLLEFERGVGHQVPALVNELRRARVIAEHEVGVDGALLWSSSAFRRRFADLEYRTLAIRLTEDRLVYSLPAGQNVGDFAASLMKLAWSEMGQEIDELIVDALGPYAMVDQGPAFEAMDPALVVGPDYARTPIRRYLDQRVLTIAGGSSEVQRTILAKLMLG